MNMAAAREIATHWQFTIDERELIANKDLPTGGAAYFKRHAEGMADALGRRLVAIRGVEVIQTPALSWRVSGTVILGGPVDRSSKPL